MFSNHWLELTRRTKNYRVVVRLGWTGWLPEVQEAIAPKQLWIFMSSYWYEFVEILKYRPYFIDLESVDDYTLTKFFLDTGLIGIELKDSNVELSKNQTSYIAQLARYYAPQILQWLKEGNIYASELV